MTYLPLEQLMHELSAYLQTPLVQERDIYRVLVPVPLGRQQEVSISVRDDDDGRPVIAFASTVGMARPGVDCWRLLRANASSTYGRVALIGDMVVVVASQLVHTAQAEEVLVILREVAHFADQLERELFLFDQY